jgi:hypothetical protein
VCGQCWRTSSGEDGPEHLASLALGHLRVKIPQLRLTLEGKIRSHHRFLLRRLLDQIQFLEHEIALLDERAEDIGRQRPDLAQAVACWNKIPGIDQVAAWKTKWFWSFLRHAQRQAEHFRKTNKLGRNRPEGSAANYPRPLLDPGLPIRSARLPQSGQALRPFAAYDGRGFSPSVPIGSTARRSLYW